MNIALTMPTALYLITDYYTTLYSIHVQHQYFLILLFPISCCRSSLFGSFLQVQTHGESGNSFITFNLT